MRECMEGIDLALQWSNNLLFILESDRLVVANMLKGGEQKRSSVAALVGEAKRLLALGREHVISHVRRSQNVVSHTLAQLGRSTPKTAVWLRHGPVEIGTLCQLDCSNPP